MQTIKPDATLKLERITALKNDRKAKKLYTSAFPKIEQLPYWRLKFGSFLKTQDFFAFTRAGEVVAIAFLLAGEECALLYYFAVEESLRGTGIGSECLALLKQYYTQPLAVIMKPMDADAEDAAQRLRRKAFYERAGFSTAEMTVTDWSGSFAVFTTANKPDREKLYRMLKRFNPLDGDLAVTENEDE